MSYLGNTPAEAYTSTVKDSFNGDGSTTAFTLSQPSTTNNLRVVVENVIQDPTVAYSCSGTTLTFTSAPPSGTANIYAVHLGPATMTAVPPSEINNATNFTDGITVDKNGGTVITADRASSDGTIIDLQKDGTPVGAILSLAGDMVIGTGDVGFRFDDGSDVVTPWNTTTNSARNAAIDLGHGTARFKDLYLSGGVYLGGTGSANLLDDIEFGTWTPTNSGDATGVLYQKEGYYRKIGKQVFAYFQFTLTTSFTSNKIGGLPFTVGNIFSLSIVQNGGGSSVFTAGSALCPGEEGSTAIRFYTPSGGVTSAHNPATGDGTHRGCCIYMTT
jgi:hypothetical protein